MSQQEDGAERSFEPTPQKLLDARRKGEIVKSQDVLVAASYLGALLCMVLAAQTVAQSLLNLGGGMLASADELGLPLRQNGSGQAGAILGQSLFIITLIIAPAFVLVLAALFAQQAIVFAPTKLAPKLSRISLLANAKNKFGPNGLFEFAKSAVKMMTYSGLLAYFLTTHVEDIVVSASLGPRLVAIMMGEMLFDFMVAVALVAGTIAVIDYGWQRHSHFAKNRMTRQEVLDETKQSEGDPLLKAKRRQRAQELATNGMLQDVPDAAVVIVNPTHYAVALKWSPTDPSPPVCVAKGVDEIAARIREAATDNDVPIFSDPPTARALHASVDIGDAIDREHFAAVAAAIRFAQEMRDVARGR